MSSHIVYEGVARLQDDNDEGQNLFAGQKLWFSHVIPQRKWLTVNAERHGAIIVDKDTDADVRLVDHARKNNAPGTHSYRYVELSIRNGRLEDLVNHAVGAPSRVSRPVGSTLTAAKSGRTPFTPEDDQLLWNWLKPFVDRGGAWKGNEIYKHLEEVNPRHTYQSWRDRWMKQTRFQNRQVTETIVPEELQSEEPAARQSQPAAQRKRRRELDDDGEAQRARSNAKDREATPTRSRRPPSRSPAAAMALEEVNRAPPAGSLRKRISPNASGSNGVEAGPSRRVEPHSPKPFTRAEYGMIYHLVMELTGYKARNEELDDFDKPWEEFAAVHDSHTATEWRHYCISRVVPDYCEQHNLSISDVARYVFGKAGDVTQQLGDQKGNQQSSPTSSTQEDFQCTNCFTTDASKWRQDKDGKIICYECARFVKLHGFHRPSTARQDGNVENQDGSRRTEVEDALSHVVLDHDDLAAQAIPTPRSSLAGRGKQPAASLSSDVAGPSRSVNQTSPERSHWTRSPSILPESPTLSRPPEPNESRKRSAGRSTQSQSTQPSNRSVGNSQNTNSSTQSQSQEVASQNRAVGMGEVQSKESDTQTIQPPNAATHKAGIAAPSFQAASKGKGKRLHDEPGNLDIQQSSSLSTDGGPPRKRPVNSSTESVEVGELIQAATASTTTTAPIRTQTGRSWLIVPENDGGGEDNIETRALQGADEERASSPVHVELISERHEVNADTGPASELEDGDVDSDADLDSRLSDLVPPNKRQRSEQFETAQESLQDYETASEQQHQRINTGRVSTQALFDYLENDDDLDMIDLELPSPPEGFEAYGVGASVVPPDDENVGEEEPLVPDEQNVLQDEPIIKKEAEPTTKQEQPPKIKLEDESYLESHHEPMVPLDITSLSTPIAELPEAPIEEEEEEGEEEEKDEEQQTEEQEQAQGEEDAAEAEADTSSPDPDPIIDDWIALQYQLHPTTRNLEPVLYKAVESTSFDFDLATDVVNIMLDNRREALNARRRNRQSNDRRTAAGVEANLSVESLLPRYMRGVWIEEDDSDLLSHRARDQDRVWMKHGRDGCDARFGFLKEMVEE